MQIRFPDDHGPGFFEPAGDLRIFIRDTIIEDFAGRRGTRPCGIDVVFQRDRNAL